MVKNKSKYGKQNHINGETGNVDESNTIYQMSYVENHFAKNQ
jgi:hypothetical protein